MNNIWEILGIESTKDKRAIRRAYGSRAKVVHPEERPEEFMALYEAYQLALKYAGRQEDQELPLAEEASGEAVKPAQEEQEPSEDYGLGSFFSHNMDKQRQELEHLTTIWHQFGQAPETFRKQWSEYLKSEEFKQIQWNPAVVRLLANGIENELCGRIMDQLALWDTYGFQDGKPQAYQQDIMSLYKALYPAFQYRQAQKMGAELGRAYRKRVGRFRKLAICTAVIGASIIVPIVIYSMSTAQTRYLKNYMAEEYGPDQFNRSVEMERQDQPDGGSIYTFTSLRHPDIPITASVQKDNYWYKVDENYGSQLVEYYARQYGLQISFENGEVKRYIAYYPDIDHLGGFCGRLSAMLNREKDLSFLNAMDICPSNIKFSDVILAGRYGWPSNEQAFDRSVMIDNVALERALKQAYIEYMYNYEAWNLTSEQRIAWNEDYVEENWKFVNNQPPELVFLEAKYKLYIRLYYGDRTSDDRWTTIGNVYQLLEASGADITIREDRSGFTAHVGGRPYDFGPGDEKGMKLDELMDLVDEIAPQGDGA